MIAIDTYLLWNRHIQTRNTTISLCKNDISSTSQLVTLTTTKNIIPGITSGTEYNLYVVLYTTCTSYFTQSNPLNCQPLYPAFCRVERASETDSENLAESSHWPASSVLGELSLL